jgi:magnesium-transporting ATPase (P-type)
MFTFIALFILVIKPMYMKNKIEGYRDKMGIMSSNKINVNRNGVTMYVQSECLVVGDLIEI